MKLWKVIPYQLSDLPLLGLYFKTHLVSESQYGSMALFQWRAVDNYLMPGIINVVKDDGKIIATLSNTPKKLFVRGEACLVAEIGDANTDSKYQRQGLLTMLINQSTQDAFERGICGVYSTPSTITPSLPAFVKKSNFLPQKGVNIRNLFFPLDIGPQIGTFTNWLFGRFVGALYLTLVCIYYYVRVLFSGLGSSVAVEECDTLPDDWDEFWEKSRVGYEAVFDRSKESLNWRFFLNPSRYKLFIARDKNIIVGYLVYRIIAEERSKRCVIADFLFLPGCDQYFNKLLLKVFKEALRIGANSISCWCLQGSTFDKCLGRFGFFHRGNIVLVWFQNEFATQLEKLRGWHFTCSDSDNV